MTSSKRRDVRYSIRFPAQLTCGQEKRSLLTEDVSYRGVFLRTDTPPLLRQLVTLMLVLPPGDRALKVHGMAVHVVEPLNPADRVPGVGIQFYALDHETRGAWEQFVRYVEKTQPKSIDQEPLVLPDDIPEPIRRKFGRHTAVLKVRVTSVIELFELFTRDVSKGGMFIETEAKLRLGSEVMVHVQHPERADTFLLDAIVRRQERQPKPGVAVEFARVDDQRREQFMDFVRGGILVDEETVIVDDEDPMLA